jgi:predicted MFS family arabinose efflux permease
MLFQQNILATFSCFGLFILVKDRPKSPPSHVATQDPEPTPICEKLSAALANKNYSMTLFCFASINGIFVSFGRILSALFAPYDFSAGYISLVGGLFIITGIISSVLFGKLLDKTSKYLRLFQMTCFCSCIFVSLAMWSFPNENPWTVGINIIMCGIFIIPNIPIGIAFACELTFPMEATVTNGILQLFG